MRTPAAALQTTLAADQMAPIVLIEFQSATVVRYALYAEDVTFDGETFSATDGMLGAIDQNIEGGSPRTVLRIQNIDRTIRDWLDAADRRGTDVVLRIVMADNLADGDAALDATYSLDAYALDGKEGRLILRDASKGNQAPGRRTQGWFCPWVYEGEECAYTGSLTSCDFTYNGKNGCTKHFPGDEVKRFGGFIGRPQRDLGVW